MLVLSIVCFKYVKGMNIIPSKYLNIFLIGIIVLNIFGILFMIIKGVITKIISGIFYVLLFIISIIGIKYSKDTTDFLDNSFNNNVDITVYSVLVLNNSNYNKIEDLNNTKMGYINFDIVEKDYLDVLNKLIKVEYEEDNLYNLYNKLLNGSLSSIVLNDTYLTLIEDEYKDFNEKVKVLYSYNVEREVKKSNTDIKSFEPINIYVSGSDSRNDTIVANSLSDVNMILTINPYTHKILITGIPRDCYVQLHGTSVLKDKLTHAGAYGLEMSETTLEDFLGIDIDYSIKVSMPSVVKIVDFLGGIDVYSDTAFRSAHYPAWYVNEGINHMDGKKALAYARERYAYSDGDKHRVRNQQQVIEAILGKITTNKDILFKYDEFLDSFSDLYVTDIPKELVSIIISDQLENMSGWSIEKQWLDGTYEYAKTYTLPNMNLIVMYPDETSLKNSVDNINKVLNEKK